MHLDAARELKAQLQASGDTRALDAPPVALGIAPADGGVRLAVRVESLSAGGEAAVARIEERAAGEIDVRETGPIVAQAGEQERVRPLLAGFSVAHVDVTAGTIGGFVTVGADAALRVLSNNHVLANEDDARRGDAVLQPGPYDGGRDPQDRIGAFERAVALRDSGANLVDAALAALADGIEAEPLDYGELGALAGVLDDPAEAGAVAKRGRTTGYTRGRVTAFELDGVQVGYTRGTLTFDDQIEIESTGSGSFSAGGDSGSLIVTAETAPRAVGLLFAGSETGGPGGTGLTFANPIAAVLRELGVSFAL